MANAATATDAPHLRRVLTLSDLILYGIVLIMPIAPIPLFGLAQKLSVGHAVTTILLAMVAMTLTAFSYGRMAALYPAAGSAYTYVGKGIHPHLGFVAGWAMFLDYLLVPLLCVIYGSLTVQRLVPSVPYPVWAFLFALAMTAVNLRGIRATATTNMALMLIMTSVVMVFIFLAVRFLLRAQGWGGLISTEPFYNPATFRWGAVATGTSLAALTYGGFDGVTTLAEEVKNPRRNVLLATVIVCLFTGIFGGLQVYLGQRVQPDYHAFKNLETAFLDVSTTVGGKLLFQAMAAILIVANIGSGLSAQAGVARLLYSMGRDNVLPRRFFSYLSPRRATPDFNICLVGMFSFLGALMLDYERSAELINFGAFLAFMGVNAAVIRQFWFLKNSWRKRNLLTDVVLPGLGFLFCLTIWMSLQTPAKMIGGIWFVLGITYDAVKTRGFRTPPVITDFGEEHSTASSGNSGLS
ncbi:MAG: APC family permease [Bryobacteraceae bacterium]